MRGQNHRGVRQSRNAPWLSRNPIFRSAVIKIVGIEPYCQHAFPQKVRAMLEEQHRRGNQGKNTRRIREPRDFEGDYEQAMHKDIAAGWFGIPAAALRNAAISACRVAGFTMTRAKLSIWFGAEGHAYDGTSLVRIYGKTNKDPQPHRGAVRNESGVVDIRWRPMWMQGWWAMPKVFWDEDQFGMNDVLNLMTRAGLQVGIGEGRPDSANSNGLGWGRFELDDEAITS
jgi:hypothetical protein